MTAQFTFSRFGWSLLMLVFFGSSNAQEIFAHNRVDYHNAGIIHQANGGQTLRTILDRIEKQHDVSFICRSELLQIEIETGNEKFAGNSFASRLEKLLRPYQLMVKKVTSQQYVITTAGSGKKMESAEGGSESLRPVAFSGLTTNIQGGQTSISTPEIPQLRVSGTVLNRSNAPLVGVTVSVKNSTVATSTDEEGRFQINIPSAGSVLVFSSVGFLPQEVTVGGSNAITVVMDEDTRPMQEVVVVGYGTQRKINLTGAVDAINAKDLENRPITSTTGGLQGLLPGVTISTNNARPGVSGGTVRIRGIGTIGNSNPLILVDGIEQNMDLINPDDIESVSVLKDASSAAIYGSRAANGVLLITTKKGKKDAKPTINYSYYYGIQKPTAKADFLGSPEYMELLNESQLNVGRTPTFDPEEIEIAKNGTDPNYYANTKWLDEIFKTSAPQQNHNVSVNGGSEKSTYYLSYGYLNQEGIVTGNGFGNKRHNVRLRLNTELLDRLKVDANLGYIDRMNQELSAGTDENSGVIYSAHQISPLVPVRFTNGQWGYGGGSQNPVGVATDAGHNKFNSQEVSGNFSGQAEIIKGLNARVQYGMVISNSNRNILYKTLYYYYPDSGELWYRTNPTNSVHQRDYINRYQNLTGQLDYEKSIGNHDIKIMGGASEEWNRSDYMNASRQGVISEDLPVLNIGSANQLNSGDASHWAIRSYFGRLNYMFNNKYLLEANIRHDGSSRFSPNSRWGTFPSVSAGWRITEEAFMDPFRSVLSTAKLRGSWGKLGNQYVSASYVSTMQAVGTMPIGTSAEPTPAFAQTRSANPILSWESVTMTNLGLDLGFLNDRLNVTADYFVKTTNDILLTIPLPDVLGVSEPPQNAGSVENKGWELNIGWNDKAGDVKYKLNFNISDVRNKVTDLAGVPPTIGDRVRMVGYPIDAFYGLVADRISQVDDYEYDEATNKYTPKFPVLSGDLKNTKPGDIIYKDLDGDKQITLDKDRQVIGNAFPRYTYAFRGNVEWKGFDFNIFLQGVGKGNGYITGAGRHAFINESTNPQTVHLDRWTPENTDASYPRLTYQQSHNQRFSSFWIEDAAYLRLKNIQLGYTLPSSLTSNMRIQRLRVYVSGDNLFTKSDFFYAFDPETPWSNGGMYPQIKTMVFGLNVQFR